MIRCKVFIQELNVKVPEWDHVRASQDTIQLRSRLPEPFALDKVCRPSSLHPCVCMTYWQVMIRDAGFPVKCLAMLGREGGGGGHMASRMR